MCPNSFSLLGESMPEGTGMPFWGPVETKEHVLGPTNHYFYRSGHSGATIVQLQTTIIIFQATAACRAADYLLVTRTEQMCLKCS